LLNNSFDWGKLKQEIAKQPPIIDVNVHLEEMMARLKEIHTEYITDEFVTLRESASYLRDLLQNIANDYNELHLFKLTSHSDDSPASRATMKMQVVRLDLMNDVFDARFAILFEGQ